MAFPNGYKYYREITFDKTKVSGSTDLTSFPVLFSGVYWYLAHTAFGGGVANTNGFDIRFETTGGTKLDWELSSYTPATGTITGWIRIPTLPATSSGTSSLTIIMWYGNSSITTNVEQNVTGVWDTNYKAVWHLEAVTGGAGSVTDSTASPQTGTPTNVSADTAAKIGGGGAFNGSTSFITTGIPSKLQITGAMTWSCWAKFTNHTNPQVLLGHYTDDGLRYGALIWQGGSTMNCLISPSVNVNFATGAAHTTNATWELWHAVYIPSTSLKLYKNGVEFASNTTSVPAAQASATSDSWQIGRFADDSGATTQYSFNGSLDEARVSNIARSVDWLVTEYNTSNSPSTFYSIGNGLSAQILGSPSTRPHPYSPGIAR